MKASWSVPDSAMLRISLGSIVNRMRVRSHARWIGFPNEVAVFRERRDEQIRSLCRAAGGNDETGIRVAGGDATCVQQRCAVAPHEQWLAMAILILDELER